jgi:predicted kinase
MNLIILRGKTGTGKSSLQNAIVETFKFTKVEIDEIKIKKYGTTTICKPPIDFKEAGSLAEEYLLSGQNVIVEEAFLSKQHIQYLLQGFKNSQPAIIYIRLECSKETALKRKSDILNSETINFQHRRPIESIEGELTFDTDKLSTKDIINAIRDKII